MSPGNDPPADAGLAAPGGDGGAPARILVVDDEPSVIDVFQEFLSAQGYALWIASSGEEAVQKIPELRPDIILTDINLPGLSGLEVMRHAKQVDPEVAVIVVTGYASASTAIDALRQGAFNYVTKPFDLDEVHQIVERAIANRRLKAINRQLVEDLRLKNEILQHHEQELRERVRLATWQMTQLYDVGKAIMVDLELVPRVNLITAKITELFGAPAAVAYLKRTEGEDFRLASALGVDQVADEDGASMAWDPKGPLARCVQEQRAVRHVQRPEDGPATSAATFGGKFPSVLAVPMVAGGEVIGILTALGKPGGFSDEDESFMVLYASQAASAIRNSQLYEHTKSLDRLKSEFVAVVSHEIRTPLTSVKGAVELLSDDRFFENTDQQTKLLTIAHANAERLLVLINDILDFSKLESASLPMNIERQRLEPVIQQAAGNLRTLIEERRIHLDFNLAAGLPDLMIDPNRVAQVLTNLLSNAIKFSAAGGRIELTAESWEGAVRVGVRDFGEGIAPADLPKLFKKFSQIDSGSTRKVGGTGLGLVISKGIVEQLGGHIWVDSVPTQGSTFYFTLMPAERGATETISRS